MKKILGIVLLALIIGSCEELERPNTNQFVVEGFLTADFDVSDIKVKETVTLNEDIVDIPIADALVIVSSGNENIMLDFDPATGRYIDPSGALEIQSGEQYDIEINVNGTIATSSSVVPEKPTGLNLSETRLVVPTLRLSFTLREQIVSLFEEEVSTFSWEGVPGRSYFVVIETLEEDLEPILPSEIPAEAQELLSSFRFISAPSEATSFDIRAIALETYGRHVAKVYSVNEEYVDLFNSETQDSRDLNEPPSNIANGLGIFTAFAVDSLEFTVERN